MQIIKFKVTKTFAERYEGVAEGDVLDGVLDGDALEVCVPLVEDVFGFKVPKSVPAVIGVDGVLHNAD